MNDDDYSTPVKTVLCIPGQWPTRNAIQAAINNANPAKFRLDSDKLIDLATGDTFEIVIHDRDDRMRKSFLVAADLEYYNWLQHYHTFLDDVEAHTFLVYVIGNTGTMKSAHAIARAAGAILQSDGAGVKIESSGKVRTREQWEKAVSKIEKEWWVISEELFCTYVLNSLDSGKDTFYSRGMHNIGLRDAIVSGLDRETAIDLLEQFNHAYATGAFIVEEGELFPAALEPYMDPISEFEITEELNPQPHEGDELFENTFGMWRLRPK